MAAEARAREGATDEEKTAAMRFLREAELAHAREKLRFAEVRAGRTRRLAQAGVGSKRLAAHAESKAAEARARLEAIEGGEKAR